MYTIHIDVSVNKQPFEKVFKIFNCFKYKELNVNQSLTSRIEFIRIQRQQ